MYTVISVLSYASYLYVNDKVGELIEFIQGGVWSASPLVELESLSAMLSVSLVSGLAVTIVTSRSSTTGDITNVHTATISWR